MEVLQRAMVILKGKVPKIKAEWKAERTKYFKKDEQKYREAIEQYYEIQ